MIKITADLSKAFLSNLLSANIDQVLANESLDYNGFDVEVTRQGAAVVTARKKSIFVDLPLDIDITKEGGLFSIEAKGAIMISLTMSLDISTDLQLSTKSEIAGWKWIEEPSVKIGVFNVPASKIANIILHKMDEKIANDLDKAIAEKIDLQNLLNQKLAALIDSKQVSDDPKMYIRAQVEGIQSSGFVEHVDKIEFPIYLDLSNHITDIFETAEDWHLPPFIWVENIPLEYSQDVNLTQHYDQIEGLILSKIDGLEVGGKTIRANEVKIDGGDQLQIQVNITEPIESTFILNGVPVLHDGTLNLLEMNVDMNTPNIIYKMTSPIIEKILRGEIDDKLPINLHELVREKIKDGLQKANQQAHLHVKMDADHFNIDSVTFDHEKMEVQATAKDVDIVVIPEHVPQVAAMTMTLKSEEEADIKNNNNLIS